MSTLGVRFICVLLSFLIFLPPIDDAFSYIGFILCAYLIFFCFDPQKLPKQKKIKGLAIFSLLLGLQLSIPKLAIQEGLQSITFHRYNNDDVYLKALPSSVVNLAKSKSMDKIDNEWGCRGEDGCWHHMSGPARAYSFDVSTLWAKANFTRKVSQINFDSVSSLKASFFHSHYGADGEKNFFGTPQKNLNRFQLPFYTRHIINSDMIGGKFIFSGDLFLNEKSLLKSPLVVKDQHVGQSLFGLSVENELKLRFIPPLRFKIFSLVSKVVALLFVLLFLLYFVQWDFFKKDYQRHLIFLASFCFYAYPQLQLALAPYFPGGNDGLIHMAYGLLSFEHLVGGNIGEFFRGGVDVYYFMPGLRYFWVLTLALFGNTNLGLLSASLFFPLAIHQFFKKLCGPGKEHLSFMVTIAFVIMFQRSVTHLVSHGLAEPLGYLLFLGGMATIIRPKNNRALYFGLLLFSLAPFFRPNLVLGYSLFIMAFLTPKILNFSFRKKVAVLACLSVVFLSLAHNLIFGGSFTLFTSAGVHPVNLKMPPSVYLLAFKELIFLEDYSALVQVKEHLSKWLFEYNFAKSFVNVVAFVFTITQLIGTKSALIRSLSLCALGLHVTHFFWHPAGRYAIMSWFLSYGLLFLGLQSMVAKFSRPWEASKLLKEKFPHLKGLQAFLFYYRPLICPFHEILDHIDSGKKVLDIGCGKGVWAFFLKSFKQAKKVYGIDVNKSDVSFGRALLSDEYREDISLATYDGKELPVVTKSIDYCTMIDVLHHIPKEDHLHFLKNLKANMPVGSTLIIKDIDASDFFCLQWNRFHDGLFSSFYGQERSLDELSGLLKEAGLNVRKKWKSRFFLYSHYCVVAVSE